MFQIDLCGQDIRIGQDGRINMNLGMTGGRVWDAAVVLAKMVLQACIIIFKSGHIYFISDFFFYGPFFYRLNLVQTVYSTLVMRPLLLNLVLDVV